MYGLITSIIREESGKSRYNQSRPSEGQVETIKNPLENRESAYRGFRGHKTFALRNREVRNPEIARGDHDRPSTRTRGERSRIARRSGIGKPKGVCSLTSQTPKPRIPMGNHKTTDMWVQGHMDLKMAERAIR
jgi:hypothetical protein